MDFELVSKYSPTGDQPEAIKQIVNNFNSVKMAFPELPESEVS